MAFFQTDNIKIAGITGAVPKKVQTGNDFLDRFNNDIVDKFQMNTGVNKIHTTATEQTASDLGYEAANHLLKSLGIVPKQIGLLLFTSLSFDYKRPSTAMIIHKRLHLSKECACMDIGQGCAGFVYGHQVMNALLSTMKNGTYGLLIVSESPSKLTNPNDHTSMLLGDGGSAILYQSISPTKNILDAALLRADGERYQTIIVPAGGFRVPDAANEEILCSDANIRTPYNIYMNGMDVFTFSIREVPDAIHTYFEKTESSVENYDLFALHQANGKIIDTIRKRTHMPVEKTPKTIHKYGNTSGSTIPLLLCDTYGDSENTEPQRILAVGFGVGLAWGVTSFLLSPDKVFPVIETDDYFQEGQIDIRNL